MDLRRRWRVTCALLLTVGCAGTELSDQATTAATPRAEARPEIERESPQPFEPTESDTAEHEALEAKAAPAPALDEGALSERAMPARSRPAKKSDIGLGSLGVIGRGYGGGGSGMGYAKGPGALVMPKAETAPSREGYAHVAESDFIAVRDQALSTFSIDVDTASYSNVRRFLREGRLPPADAVRIEELINYFDYDYPTPEGKEPFSTYAEVSDCPWNTEHRLVHIGIKGRVLDKERIPARNLVFLLDVSGSMESPDKLPLLTRGLSMLAKDLRDEDRLSIVVYAGASGLVLPPTSGSQRGKVLEALNQLRAGGSTNGAAGIELAYDVAQRNFVKGGINRVILATDGDFNVGPSSEGELVRIIEQKRKSGVFLTVLGFGTGNLQDSRMEQLADKGNGNYAYIDSLDEAHKVLVREAGATLVTIAKDVKLQVEFNPAHVASYRLIGYENRKLAARDFNDDTKDAGEIGAGHTVTALYEIVPAGSAEPEATPMVDALRYQEQPEPSAQARRGELMTVKIRYKAPDGEQSKLTVTPLVDRHRALSDTSHTFRFSAAVAGFGMLLRGSDKAGTATLEALTELADSAIARDPHGEKRELLDMMRAAQRLGLGKRG